MTYKEEIDESKDWTLWKRGQETRWQWLFHARNSMGEIAVQAALLPEKLESVCLPPGETPVFKRVKKKHK